MGSDEVVHRPPGILTHVVEDVGVAPQGHCRVGVAKRLGEGPLKRTGFYDKPNQTAEVVCATKDDAEAHIKDAEAEYDVEIPRTWRV